MKFYYRIIDNSIEIIRCLGGDSKIVLPEQIHGLPVTALSAYAFSDRKTEVEEEVLVWEEKDTFTQENAELRAGLAVEEVIFPDTVSKIGNYIFYGCKNLKSLEFSDTLSQIGSGAFTGCSALSSLCVHMQHGKKSCVKEILGDLWQRIDVEILYENSGCKNDTCEAAACKSKETARLVFPEHYEEAVENTPARILFTQHHGSGNNYRQCFYDREMDYRKYDSLFTVATAWEEPEILADMAFGRLSFPHELTEEARTTYQRLIQERYQDIMRYLVEKECLAWIRVITEQAFWAPEMLEYALELAVQYQKVEILSYLMNEKQKWFPRKKKKFVL